jgi:hypothetical protein
LLFDLRELALFCRPFHFALWSGPKSFHHVAMHVRLRIALRQLRCQLLRWLFSLRHRALMVVNAVQKKSCDRETLPTSKRSCVALVAVFLGMSSWQRRISFWALFRQLWCGSC